MTTNGCFETEVAEIIRQAKEGAIADEYPRAWETFRDSVPLQELILELAHNMAPASTPQIMQQVFGIVLVAGIAIGATMPRGGD